VASALTKRQQQGESSREAILDAAERLMATRGYAATSISDIRAACALPASSIYWHFGSKEGVLAAVIERGAERYFAAIPPADAGHDVESRLAAAADLLAQHPDFMRLLFMQSLERNKDATVAAAVRRVRDTAIARFREGIASMVPEDTPPDRAERIVAELTTLAVALSDGVFFADHLEPETTDVAQMYRRLFQTVTALIPIMLEER
jgi:AcrR family transcriptional regulator